ncbi:uncharacterized protein [Amphiura filiformis]|uniref:uncharacterized protein n=1 Tax=Amphiura filiformis TaxID=82378 RepID=UPI003B2198BA
MTDKTAPVVEMGDSEPAPSTITITLTEELTAALNSCGMQIDTIGSSSSTSCPPEINLQELATTLHSFGVAIQQPPNTEEPRTEETERIEKEMEETEETEWIEEMAETEGLEEMAETEGLEEMEKTEGLEEMEETEEVGKKGTEEMSQAGPKTKVCNKEYGHAS